MSKQEQAEASVATASPKRENAMLVLQRGAEAGRRWPLDRTRIFTIWPQRIVTFHCPTARSAAIIHALLGREMATRSRIWAARMAPM